MNKGIHKREDMKRMDMKTIDMGKVDIIIPTYRPDRGFYTLIQRLQKQSILPNKIIIMNTERKYWDKKEWDKKFADFIERGKMEIHHISIQDFDHGATRNQGIQYSNAEYFICMTQDAIPKDIHLLRNLLKPMREERVKLSYAKQIPKKDAGAIERFTRQHNYPKKSFIKSEADRKKWGIKLYFASNVCACFERKTFEALGGFKEGIILNEDMIYACKLLKSGKSIAYVGEAKVYHSHEYTGLQQFKRNFDIGMSQAEHPEVFGGFYSESEGIKLVKMTARYLMERGEILQIPKLIYMSACKYIGFWLGKRYQSLPRYILRICAMNHKYIDMIYDKNIIK